MKIAICENEKIFSEDSKEKCMEYMETKSISGEIYEFSSGEDFLEFDGDFDILLLDIEMEKVSGIEVKKELEKRRSKTAIVFLTSHIEYMSDAFGKQVFKFLKKPLEKEELFEVLDKITNEIEGDFLVEIEDENIPFLRGRAILFIKAEDKYTSVQTTEGKHLVRTTMKDWEDRLKGYDFYRAHKSFIVNMAHIKRIGVDLILEDGTKINIGRKNEKIFREKYNAYLRKLLG